MHAQSSTPAYFSSVRMTKERDKRSWIRITLRIINHNIYIAKDPRAVIERQGPGISPGYYERGPQLLS